jgi:uncharacterized protein YeaO (DUF488 family)
MGIVNRRRYMLALARTKATLGQLRQHARRGTLTLVYSARDIDKHNDAVAMAFVLRRGARATRLSARS